MKKFFSIFLAICAAVTYANPIEFEECDDDECCDSGYHLETPIFDDTEGTRPKLVPQDEDSQRFRMSYASWRRYKSNFGMEKIFIRFPQKPAVSNSGTLLNAYAYDHAVMYSFSGYYPPISHIDVEEFFRQILDIGSEYPHTLLNSSIYQVSSGDWVLDYTSHDYIANLVIKSRTVVTPFNSYTLQCVKPNGVRDYFDYFVDNFWINCSCQD